MKTKVNGELKDTHRYILTFSRPDPPGVIKIVDWHQELVELYIPRPMRCVKCWRYGHTQKRCRRELMTCAQCGQEGHQARQCNKEAKCANCSGNHKSMDINCPVYIFKSEVLATQVRMKYGYREAEEDVKERFHASGRQYSFPRQRTPQNAEAQEERTSQRIQPRTPQTTMETLSLDAPTPTPKANASSTENKTITGNLREMNNESAATKGSSNVITLPNTSNKLIYVPTTPEDNQTTKSKAQKDEKTPRTSVSRKGPDHKKGTPQKSPSSITNFLSQAGTSTTQRELEKKQIRPKETDPSEAPPILDVSQIPLPETSELSDSSEQVGNEETTYHYDAWEDKFVKGPSPVIPKPPPCNVANVVRKIEGKSPRLLTATEFYKDRKITPKKETKRQQKRKQRSSEKAKRNGNDPKNEEKLGIPLKGDDTCNTPFKKLKIGKK